jgi:hypothetical protein
MPAAAISLGNFKAKRLQKKVDTDGSKFRPTFLEMGDMASLPQLAYSIREEGPATWFG